MKKLFLLWLIFDGITMQGSTIIHKSINYITDPWSKVAIYSSSRSIKNVDLEKITSDYWNHLKTGEGDYFLYFLIDDETLKSGYKRFGLTADDIQEIKENLLAFKMFNTTEEFAYSVLPEWLQEHYENKQQYVVDQFLNKEKTPNTLSKFISPVPKKWYKKFYTNNYASYPDSFIGYKKGLLDYLIQVDYKARFGYKKYMYLKRGSNFSEKFLKEQMDNIRITLLLEENHYINIQELKGNSNLIQEATHIIVPAHILLNPDSNAELLQILIDALDDEKGGNSRATVIIAFDDIVQSIPNQFNLPQGLNIKNLVITGRGLRSVGDDFLYGCENLKSIIFPEGLKLVGNYCLFTCTNLESVILPEGLMSVGNYFLAYAEILKSVIVSEGLKLVGNYFLYFCEKLENVILPERLTSVGNNFFSDCHNLKSLIVPKGLTLVGYNFLFYCRGLKKLCINKVLYERLKQEGKIRERYLPADLEVLFT